MEKYLKDNNLPITDLKKDCNRHYLQEVIVNLRKKLNCQFEEDGGQEGSTKRLANRYFLFYLIFFNIARSLFCFLRDQN
ncbi:MAG: hypothetical protein VR72_16935 [Clostridiaceae bacterium BRH_c20a]|nr:MAG: hypothetical protein VR72_16935 [Clostridiaceae bacterium BRH_c20a]